MSVQQSEPCGRGDPKTLLKQIELEQNAGVGTVQRERPFQKFERLVWQALFVEINQSQIAMHSRKMLVGLACVFPTADGFRHLSFIVPEVPQVIAGARIA